MSDWMERQEELKQRLDRRIARIDALRAQGLHELAAREAKATEGEQAELALLVRQAEAETRRADPVCTNCGGSGWRHDLGHPEPCWSCNQNSAIPYYGC